MISTLVRGCSCAPRPSHNGLHLIHPPIAPWIERVPGGCRVRLVCRHIREPKEVFLRIEPDNEEYLIPMQVIQSDGHRYVYEAEMQWDEGNATTVYAFKVLHDGTQTWCAADGMHRYAPPRELHFRVCPEHQPPSWVRKQIFYQIFPDRFSNSAADLAVQTDEYVYAKGNSRVTRCAWGTPIDSRLGATAFYGGDLQGIREKLDYLEERLGITAVYLNPIFRSGSNHKYDTEDYFTVDPHLGGNGGFLDLMNAIHEREMKLILDVVINHTSADHPWFNRFNRHDVTGAFNSPESPYRSWYNFESEGRYRGWKGMPHIPVLDFGNPSVQDVMYRGDGSVVRHWMREPYRIDGWRFDVMHMIGEGPGAKNNDGHVVALRKALKEENPEAYMLGEQFYEATRWLQGEQEDGGMNYYGFVEPVRAWLAGRDINYDEIEIDAAVLDAWLTEARARIPYLNQLAQFNLLDGHDTQRLLTTLESNVGRMKLAVVLLFSYPGVPCIYYGDEIGLEGGRDPDCRRCFEWDESRWNLDLFATFRSLIRLRKSRRELCDGAYLTLYAAGDVFIFARYDVSAATLIALNRGEMTVTVETNVAFLPVECHTWQEIGEVGGIGSVRRLTLHPISCQIWLGDAARGEGTIAGDVCACA